MLVSTAPLAGAVACAGGVGIIGATGMTVGELRRKIREAGRRWCADGNTFCFK